MLATASFFGLPFLGWQRRKGVGVVSLGYLVIAPCKSFSYAGGKLADRGSVSSTAALISSSSSDMSLAQGC